MGQLGDSNTGTTFSISGSFDQSQGTGNGIPGTGIIIDSLHCIVAANGSASNARLYIWRSDGVWVIRSGIFSLAAGSASQVTRTDLFGNLANTGYPGLFLPAGITVNIGVWVSSANYNWDADTVGTSRIGTGGDGNYVNHGNASGPGELAAWAIYHACNVAIRRSGAWKGNPLELRRSSAWLGSPPAKIRRSNAWTVIQ